MSVPASKDEPGRKCATWRAHSTPDPETPPSKPPVPPAPDEAPDPAHAPVEEPRQPEPPIRARRA